MEMTSLKEKLKDKINWDQVDLAIWVGYFFACDKMKFVFITLLSVVAGEGQPYFNIVFSLLKIPSPLKLKGTKTL